MLHIICLVMVQMFQDKMLNQIQASSKAAFRLHFSAGAGVSWIVFF